MTKQCPTCGPKGFMVPEEGDMRCVICAVRVYAAPPVIAPVPPPTRQIRPRVARKPCRWCGKMLQKADRQFCDPDCARQFRYKGQAVGTRKG